MYKSINNSNSFIKDSLNLKKIQENVSNLDKLQQYEIYKIISKYNNKLTENKNGIFINLTSLSDECLYKIINFVEYSLENRKRLDKLEIISQNILKNSILNKKYNDLLPNIEKSNILKSENQKKTELSNKDIIKDNIMFMENNNINDENSLDLTKELDNEYKKYQELNDIKISNIITILNKEKENDELNKEIKLDNYTQSKKNKFTGKRARLFKKCKEINKNINLNSILSYNNYNENNNNIDEDDEDDELLIPINELTEDKLNLKNN